MLQPEAEPDSPLSEAVKRGGSFAVPVVVDDDESVRASTETSTNPEFVGLTSRPNPSDRARTQLPGSDRPGWPEFWRTGRAHSIGGV